MIKNFKDKIFGKVIGVPVWSARGQAYLVTSAEETAGTDGYWRGSISLVRQKSSFSVPDNIGVIIKKYSEKMEFEVGVTWDMETSRTGIQTRHVMVTPAHLKSPEKLGELIAMIIDDEKANYYN